MNVGSLGIPGTFATILLVSSMTGIAIAGIAWRQGGWLRKVALPLGLMGFTVQLVASQGSSGPLRPYVSVCIVCVGCVNFVWCASIAWRAGGRWREFHLPLASLAVVLLFMAWGWRIAGAAGIFWGAVVAWAWVYEWLPLAWIWLAYKGGTGRIRAPAWGATVALVPAIGLEVYLGMWWRVALSLVGLLWAWGIDYATRRRGPCDRVIPALDAWIEAKTWRAAAVPAALNAAYPALVVLLLRSYTDLRLEVAAVAQRVRPARSASWDHRRVRRRNLPDDVRCSASAPA